MPIEPVNLFSISRAAKFVLLGAVLALLFGPRLAAHDNAPINPNSLTAAVFGPTTGDHDGIGPSTASPKHTSHLAAFVAALLMIAPSRRWRRWESGTITCRDTWPARLPRRRGPPVPPA